MAKQEKFDWLHPCLHCKKAWQEHHTPTRGCPQGRKHRVMGYLQYSKDIFFEPKPNWKNKKDDGFRI